MESRTAYFQVGRIAYGRGKCRSRRIPLNVMQEAKWVIRPPLGRISLVRVRTIACTGRNKNNRFDPDTKFSRAGFADSLSSRTRDRSQMTAPWRQVASSRIRSSLTSLSGRGCAARRTKLPATLYKIPAICAGAGFQTRPALRTPIKRSQHLRFTIRAGRL